jgi:hypothetical protein
MHDSHEVGFEKGAVVKLEQVFEFKLQGAMTKLGLSAALRGEELQCRPEWNASNEIASAYSKRRPRVHAFTWHLYFTLTGTNMRTTSVIARAGLVLSLLTSPVISLSTPPPVKVSLRTSWPSPPFLLEHMYGFLQQLLCN